MKSNNVSHKLSPQADKLIRKFAFGSGVTGFIPFPLLDMLGLISLQRLMLYRLSKLYGVPFEKNLGKAWITTLASGTTSSAASPLLGSTLLKVIPGIGAAAGGLSLAALSSAATYAVGKVFQQHFENGGNLADFNPETAKEHYQTALKEGQNLAQQKNK